MAGTSPENMTDAHADDLPALVRALAAEPRRHIALAGTVNFRDAGGYPVAGGGEIRWRRLFRSDALRDFDRAASRMLGTLGLRTIVDLRTSYEAEIARSPVDELAVAGALTMHVSLIGEDLTGLPAELAEIYDYIIDRQGAAIGAAFKWLARPGGLPALVHCTAGKDRTGIVIALTLAALGVPDRIVAADYAMTSLFIDPEHTATIGRVQEDSGLGERLTAALLASPPELILRALARAREQAGSIVGYLIRHGVTQDEFSTLRAVLVTARRADAVGG